MQARKPIDEPPADAAAGAIARAAPPQVWASYGAPPCVSGGSAGLAVNVQWQCRQPASPPLLPPPSSPRALPPISTPTWRPSPINVNYQVNVDSMNVRADGLDGHPTRSRTTTVVPPPPACCRRRTQSHLNNKPTPLPPHSPLGGGRPRHRENRKRQQEAAERVKVRIVVGVVAGIGSVVVVAIAGCLRRRCSQAAGAECAPPPHPSSPPL